MLSDSVNSIIQNPDVQFWGGVLLLSLIIFIARDISKIVKSAQKKGYNLSFKITRQGVEFLQEKNDGDLDGTFEDKSNKS